MRKSTKKEVREVDELVLETRAKMEELLQSGKRIHIIWDFDGVLASSRSDDIFEISGFDLKKYFEHEERLLFESPEPGPWLLPIAHRLGLASCFPDRFTQDIVTARSSYLASRVHVFCLGWHLSIRWALFIGHQPKKDSFRIILKSLKDDPDCFVFCVDDGVKHIKAFEEAGKEENMEDRAFGIVSPVIRNYTKRELKKYFTRVMRARGKNPLRVRDPSDNTRGFVVLPRGIVQFREQINRLRDGQSSKGHYFELRNAFVKVNGEVGKGRFKTEEELEFAMNQFIMDLACP